jgi:hypothetical protein
MNISANGVKKPAFCFPEKGFRFQTEMIEKSITYTEKTNPKTASFFVIKNSHLVSQ